MIKIIIKEDDDDDDDDDDNDDDDNTSDHDFPLHRPFTKRKKGGTHLKELSKWKDGDSEPEEIFFWYRKSRCPNGVSWTSQYH